MQDQYHCTMRLARQILETDGYRVSLQGNFYGSNHTYVTFQEYSPRQHSKCKPGQLWAEALSGIFGKVLIYFLIKRVSQSRWKWWEQARLYSPAEYIIWALAVGMKSQCLSILTFSGLQRVFALEYILIVFLVCILFACAMDNVPLDCFHGSYLLFCHKEMKSQRI